jgi:rSAM/selenodomain-associated transferase 2
MRLSVIIPALNEAGGIARVVRRVQEEATAAPGHTDVIVVDGGSADGTPEVAEPWARVVQAPRGRARQMNRGAAVALGDAFLFLHADTMLPRGGLQAVRQALCRPGVDSGTFRLRFDSPSPLLRFYALCTHLPWRGLCFGDRGQFVTREAFDAVGGFPDWPVYEDLELARRLIGRGGFTFLRESVTTSARRFRKNGTLRQQIRNVYLWLHYVRGTPPHEVAHLYSYEA